MAAAAAVMEVVVKGVVDVSQESDLLLCAWLVEMVVIRVEEVEVKVEDAGEAVVLVSPLQHPASMVAIRVWTAYSNLAAEFVVVKVEELVIQRVQCPRAERLALVSVGSPLLAPL